MLFENGEVEGKSGKQEKEGLKEKENGVEKKKKKEMKKKQKKKEERIFEVRDLFVDSDLEDFDFWMFFVGDRWDFDDGGDRWGLDVELELGD